MLAWIIVIAVLLLLLLLPLGAAAAYRDRALTLNARFGPVSVPLYPRPDRQTKPSAEEPEAKPEKKEKPKKDRKIRITRQDIPELLGILFRFLHRFRLHLSIDRLRLCWKAGAQDPYDAVIQYGRINGVLAAVLPLAEEVLKIRERDIQTDVDLTAQRPEITAEVVATLQVWELLFLALGAAWALGLWYLKKRKSSRRTAGETA